MKKLLGILVLTFMLNSCGTPGAYFQSNVRPEKASAESNDGGFGASWNRPTIEIAVFEALMRCQNFNPYADCQLKYINDRLVSQSEAYSWKTKFQNNLKNYDQVSRSVYDPTTGRSATAIVLEKRKVVKKTKPKKTEKKKSKEKIQDGKVYAVASGTGFFINKSGHIVSNNHVIDSCQTVKIHYDGIASPVTILATDRVNDLSLMKSKVNPKDYFSVSATDASLLDEIYVAGYPFGKAISSSVKVTKGVVSALTGLGNNYSNIQIDAALQPGNSGGPIINKKGNVVGVAVAKLDYKAVIEDFGAIPEGTNFGIKSSTVQQFIKANNVGSETGGYREMSSQDIGKKIQKATVYLDCWMTAQQINQYKTRKTFFTNIE